MRITLVTLALWAIMASHAGAQAAPSPYTADTARTIKALSDDEVRAYVEGDGLGFARAAELNHYPGPRHALDLAARLDLDHQQLARIRGIFDEMRAAALPLGRHIVDRERDLDRLFAGGAASEEAVRTLTAEIARLQGELRAVHLTAHLRTRAVLTSEQVSRYDGLRGYHGGHGH
jgi:Spy/CpxP family protein refolding chaperone